MAETITIKELLDSLQNPADVELPNNADTWRRIANEDSFDELGLSGTELEDFIKEWISNNDYENMI